jgi:hypothetical protein
MTMHHIINNNNDDVDDIDTLEVNSDVDNGDADSNDATSVSSNQQRLFGGIDPNNGLPDSTSAASNHNDQNGDNDDNDQNNMNGNDNFNDIQMIYDDQQSSSLHPSTKRQRSPSHIGGVFESEVICNAYQRHSSNVAAPSPPLSRHDVVVTASTTSSIMKDEINERLAKRQRFTRIQSPLPVPLPYHSDKRRVGPPLRSSLTSGSMNESKVSSVTSKSVIENVASSRPTITFMTGEAFKPCNHPRVLYSLSLVLPLRPLMIL